MIAMPVLFRSASHVTLIDRDQEGDLGHFPAS